MTQAARRTHLTSVPPSPKVTPQHAELTEFPGDLNRSLRPVGQSSDDPAKTAKARQNSPESLPRAMLIGMVFSFPPSARSASNPC
jgi:hypothetical protein